MSVQALSPATVLLAAAILAGCSPAGDAKLERYWDVLNAVEFSDGSRIVDVASRVCPLFHREDFSSASSDGRGSVRYIDEPEIETWVLSTSHNVLGTKLLSINVDRTNQSCSAFAKLLSM